MEVDRLEGRPNLRRIVLDSVYMRPLFSREREIQLTCRFVRSNIPFGLKVSLRVIRALLSTTDNSPEALGMQKMLR